MVTINSLILLAATATAAVIPRDAAQVQSDLNTINADTQKLTSDVNAYSGGLFGALPSQNDESQLDKDIKSATDDANNSAAVSDSEAQSIISYIKNTLEPNIEKALTALKSKKSQFASAGLQNTVLQDLKDLKTDTDALGSALLAKAPSGEQASGQAVVNEIDADFNDAIQYFS